MIQWIKQNWECLWALVLKRPYISLAISGAMAVLGFAPIFFWPAYGLAIFVLFALLDEAKSLDNRFWHLFCRGWVFGFFHFLFGMFWVGAAFLVDAEQFAWLMPFAVTLLPAGLAIFYGLAAVLYGISGNKAFRVFWFAFCVGLFEFLRGNILTGLPWNLPAYIWKAGGAISQSGAIIGPYGVSVMTIFLFSSFAVIREKFGKAICLAALAVFATAWFYGVMRLNVPSQPVASGGIRIAVGNAGFSQKQLFTPGNENLVAREYLKLLNSREAKAADVVVWPEGTFPVLALEDGNLLYEINQSLGQRTLIFGAPRREFGTLGESYYNSIAWLKAGNGMPQTLAIYDKYHLVPFGEYLPFGAMFRALGISSLVSIGEVFTKGPSPKTIEIAGLPAIDPRVCYEIIFPNFRQKQQAPADWIVNVSVDAWYGDLLGPDQHYNQARWRSIETGLPLVRSASGGWSAIVNGKGQALIEIRSGGEMVSAILPLKIPNTPYSIYGEIIYGGIMFVFACMGIAFGRTSVLCLLTLEKISRLLSGKGQ
ncbi:MAG: apolipoprotein N-acyltransferase [Hyphomonadaceae bacterium]|nr:MAG: apolipoprotein N-acyltransferase [Hyphomonadaceae bacterium]KAF0187050.1 MAG: apolipoprotein N-acyltransferase [Hyphomonadaceae bacterium]